MLFSNYCFKSKLYFINSGVSIIFPASVFSEICSFWSICFLVLTLIACYFLLGIGFFLMSIETPLNVISESIYSCGFTNLLIMFEYVPRACTSFVLCIAVSVLDNFIFFYISSKSQINIPSFSFVTSLYNKTIIYLYHSGKFVPFFQPL